MTKPRKLLAVASGGGHWVQMTRLWPAFEDFDLVVATVHVDYRETVPEGARFHLIRDATRWSRWDLLVLATQMLIILVRERPDVVLSTGAAPGLFALVFGKMLGAKTVWIDSLANVEAMSMSGRRVRRFATLWLSQWPHVAKASGARHEGSLW